MGRREQSKAPRERVNITYRPATGDAEEQRELPLKVLAMADFLGRTDDRPLESRKPVNVNKDNFDEVMQEMQLGVNTNIEDRLSGEPGAELNVSLRFNSLKDFTPDGIVEQVPELRKLLQLRQALTALKGPLGNIPTFRKKLEQLLGDGEARKRLMSELGIEAEGNE